MIALDHRVRRISKFLAGTVVACIMGLPSALASDTTNIPVPKHIIYAGQTISSSLLRDRTVPLRYLNRASVFVDRSQLVGKVAKTTLVPSRPIPTNYVTEPDVVKVNQRALMRFRSGALTITAEASPLNSAKAGEMVRARNLQTGVIVYGTAQEDGSIIVGARQ